MKLRTNVLAERECESWLLSSLSKILSLDGQVTNGHNVLRDKSFHGSRPILDLERCTVGLVSRRGTRFVLGMKETGDRGALGTRNPKVA